jgi:hypothetical protein
MFTPAFVNGVASVKIHIVKATDAQKKAYQEEIEPLMRVQTEEEKAYQEEMRNDNQR